jgi:hypothetical protein
MIVGIQTRRTSMIERKLLSANSTQSFQASIFHGIIAGYLGKVVRLRRMHESPPKSFYLARSFNYVLVAMTEMAGTRTNALNDFDHRHVTPKPLIDLSHVSSGEQSSNCLIPALAGQLGLK